MKVKMSKGPLFHTFNFHIALICIPTHERGTQELNTSFLVIFRLTNQIYKTIGICSCLTTTFSGLRKQIALDNIN